MTAPVNCEPMHERARRDSEVFATFDQIGVQQTRDPSVELRLANCRTCGSTVARKVVRS